MLEALNHPEQELHAVHVAGTNGKGSTVSFMRHILQEDGWVVGTFTSPYIERFEERISVNGQPISEEDLVWATSLVRPLVEKLAQTELGSPTEFEVITTMMFLYFAHRAQPDICLIEVGLGGRFDSTNVITPLVSIITMIGHDHMHILGETLGAIAKEKAGIIKKNVPVVVGQVEGEALAVIKEKAEYEYASLSLLGDSFFLSKQELYSFVYEDTEPIMFKIGMVGKHQQHNAALALKAITLLEEKGGQSISSRAKQVGIQKATWPGRLEWLAKEPPLLLDGAHNQEGFVALAKALKAHFPNKLIRMFIGSTIEKDMSWIVDAMEEAELPTTFYFTTFDFHRAASAEDLYRQAITTYKKSEPNWKEAIPCVYQSLTTDEVLVVTGSLYFISEVRSYLQNNLQSDDKGSN